MGSAGEKGLLKVKNLSKRFDGLWAVNGLSFEIEPGEIVGLIGPNGAGKTTTFNLITGFLRPTAGEVIFKGRNVVGMKPSAVAALGMVRTFQSSVLFKERTCLENVIAAHYLSLRGSLVQSVLNMSGSRKKSLEAQRRAKEILESTGLQDVSDDMGESLPHGLQRTLGVAIALSTDPELLLLDEPLTGMNHQEVQMMINLINKLNSHGLTILLIEHNLREIMKTCHRIIVLDFGQKIGEGLPHEIRNDEKIIKVYLGS